MALQLAAICDSGQKPSSICFYVCTSNSRRLSLLIKDMSNVEKTHRRVMQRLVERKFAHQEDKTTFRMM